MWSRPASPPMIAPSVISRSRQSGASPDWASASSTVSSRRPCRNWASDRFTATVTSCPASRQARAWRQASRSTQSPIGTISPHSSATGRNSCGSSRPRSGWRQRIRASTPITRPLPTSSSDWYSSTNSPRSSAWRKRCWSSPRSITRAFISGLKKRKLLRPLCLAWYMATSAWCIRVSTSVPSVGQMATPIETDSEKVLPPTSTGRATACITACATWAAWSAPPMSASSTTNSSPPRRLMVSTRRTQPRRRAATSRRTASPAWWPLWSLIALKRSRSRKSTAKLSRWRRQVASAWCMRSRNRARLGRPVSGSCSAWWRTWSSTRLRSLISDSMAM